MSRDYDWQDSALCAQVDSEIFFSSDHVKALTICAHCPVREACLRSALRSFPTGDMTGVVGGVDAKTRTAIRAGKVTVEQALANPALAMTREFA